MNAIADVYMYQAYQDLGKDFEGDFKTIGVTTVIYMAVTVGCYHFATKKNEKR